jgi:hypothetical protein
MARKKRIVQRQPQAVVLEYIGESQPFKQLEALDLNPGDTLALTVTRSLDSDTLRRWLIQGFTTVTRINVETYPGLKLRDLRTRTGWLCQK